MITLENENTSTDRMWVKQWQWLWRERDDGTRADMSSVTDVSINVAK